MSVYSKAYEGDDDGRRKKIIGAILDLSSRAGKEEKVALDLAMEDFYPHLSSRPTLLLRDSMKDPVRALYSARTLIKKHGARAIMGLGTWGETAMVAKLGNKSEIPILSLANEVPCWASGNWPFMVNAVRSQIAQMKAIAAIVKTWQWHKVNLIYQELDHSPIAPLITALQEVDVEISDLLPLPPILLPDFSLSEKLKALKNGQYRIFIVHSTTSLSNIFMEAKKLGMMEKEFVWITTNTVTDQIDVLDESIISSMQGVVGVRSYISHDTKDMRHFLSRFRVMFHSQFPNETYTEPGIHALEAYDAMKVMSIAMGGKDWRDGGELLGRIFDCNFEGLTGKFKFKKKSLEPASIFGIVNVVGKSYRELGYWSDGLGFSKTIDNNGDGGTYNESMIILGQVYWPGGPWLTPKGWSVPNTSEPVVIGVPSQNTHKEFINVSSKSVTGFVFEVFKATIALLPYNFPYEFQPFNGSYDSLVKQVGLKRFDAVVGDTAILAKRCEFAEFSQPYSASGLQMVVLAKSKKLSRPWLFKEPFTSIMWVFTGIVNIYNGIVVWLIERNHNPELRSGPIHNQIGTMISLAFNTLFSQHGHRLHSNLSRMAMIVWLFAALILVQSFTAGLASLLTLEQLSAASVDVETLKRNGEKVGCDANSFVANYLEVGLGFDPSNIVKINSEEDYATALTSGDISAAFLEVPYIKVFLAKHCNLFITSGQPFKVGGFGFVFPRSSPYLGDISKAILRLAEDGTLEKLERSLTSTFKCSSSDSDKNGFRLGLDSFWGLFVITGGTSSLALLLFLVGLVRKNWHQRRRRRHHNHCNVHDFWLFAWETQNRRRHWP
ncbi:glutamate receptor 2.8-like isoform X2 [Carica papaya]|uniref:glutamate receptor 2.8-like isoform X2 n=1 Tax=Carica papaya TaxID=3649 RepID=UPI000B8C8BA4|nr:glutamate receptor 2.8-like isoform X2 [Carica papaya]